MRKLIGKIRQSIRARIYRPIRTATYTVQRRQSRIRDVPFRALDHVKHYHASGESRYLCGVPYNRETQNTGHARAAVSFDAVSCNGCQRVHGQLLKTPGGRKRLGLDKYTLSPVDH
jgi:hypothetical protein